MSILKDPHEIVIEKRSANVAAGCGVFRDVQFDVANHESRARNDGSPIQTAHGQVFADRTGGNGMTFALQGADDLERVDNDGAIRAAVVIAVILMVATQPMLGDECLEHWLFRHATARDVDGFDTTWHGPMIACSA